MSAAALLTADGLQQGASAVGDIAAAIAGGLTNLSADEAVLMDAAKLAAMVDPALAPITVILPIAEAILAWVNANNTQGRPGSQTPMHGSGARGGANAGGRIDEEDGA